MADFIVSSACNGCRPRHLRRMRFVQRADLLAKMMQERGVARFIVAPSRFGKTALAFGYAESIFGFSRVFWVNARSPCFLRDLDKGSLAREFLAKADGASLVVLEDLPRLSAERAKAASECIDDLLSQGWEVVATATPDCAQVVDCQPDALVIRSSELLVSDDELGILRDAGELPEAFELSERISDRIPGVLWGGEDAGALLVQGIVRDGPPSEMLCVLFAAAVIGKGNTDELEMVVGPLKSDVRRALLEDYAMVSPGERGETFEAHPVPVEVVARAFSRVLSRVAAASPFAEESRFVLRLADALVAKGELERACRFADACFDVGERIEWLSARFPDLVEACCLLPAHRLFESRAFRLGAQTAEVFACEALCRAALGDEAGAAHLARRVVACQGASDAAVTLAAFVMLRCAEADLASFPSPALRLASEWAGDDLAVRCERIRSCLADPVRRFAVILAEALASSREGRELGGALAVVQACADVAAKRPQAGAAACVVASLALEGTAAATDRPAALALGGAVEHLLSTRERQGGLGLAEARLLERWDALCAQTGGSPRSERLSLLRAAAGELGLRLAAQRSAFSRAAHALGASSEAALRAVRGAKRASRVESPPGVDPLCVSLLGGLEVTVGARTVDPSAFGRQKVRTLLAILVLNQGRELLRERLAELLWPESTKDTALRSFYSTWSLLRAALETEDGACPYLARNQYSCKLDARFVVSDVAEFDALCNALLFDQPDVESWAGAYRRVNELYRGDLLPSESKNAYILHAREALRTRLIDALVSASMHLYDRGEFPAATWFAQAAVQRDASREDAYTALMRAQFASGRRTAALDTFFRCRRYLSEELGIDPSSGTRRVYSEIIEAEPDLARLADPFVSSMPVVGGARR